MVSFVQNDFVLLINAYYQADALSKNVKSSSILWVVDIQYELVQFREFVSQSSELLGQAIKDSDNLGVRGKFDKTLIEEKLRIIYGVNDRFVSEIENSVSIFSIEDGDMTSYRIQFQMASDTLNNFVGGTLPFLDNHISLKDRIYGIVNDILKQDYWEGDEIKRQIDFVRSLKTILKFSDNWIQEYAHRMFMNIKQNKDII